MTIKVGNRVPEGKLTESTEFDAACPVAPKDVSVAEAVKGKKIAVFGVPGAYTPTCSAKHVPSYLQNLDKLKAKGVNEIWCVAVNDGFVMAARGPCCDHGDTDKLGAAGKHHDRHHRHGPPWQSGFLGQHPQCQTDREIAETDWPGGSGSVTQDPCGFFAFEVGNSDWQNGTVSKEFRRAYPSCFQACCVAL